MPANMGKTEFDRIVADGLRDIDQAVDMDLGASAERRKMREYIGRMVTRGAKPEMIMKALEAADVHIHLKTLQRWLAEDGAAGILENGQYGFYRLKL